MMQHIFPYIVYFAFCVLLGLISILHTCYLAYRNRSRIKAEEVKANAMLEVLRLEEDIRNVMENTSTEEYPNIRAYLYSNSRLSCEIQERFVGAFDEIAFGAVVTPRDDLFKEIDSCPGEIIGLVFRHSDIIEALFKIKHPIRHRMALFRGKVTLFALRMLVRTLKYTQKDRSDEIKSWTCPEQYPLPLFKENAPLAQAG